MRPQKTDQLLGHGIFSRFIILSLFAGNFVSMGATTEKFDYKC